jgi:hypothetical protein
MEINKAIEIVIKKELRDEAIGLISYATNREIDYLLQLYHDDKGNIFCMEIDRLKYEMFKRGDITRDQYPSFGEFWFELKLEDDRDEKLKDLL